MQKQNVLNSPRLLELKKHRRKNLQNKVFACLLGFVVIFSLCIYISRLPTFQISSIEIMGNKVIDTEKINSFAEKDIIGKYFWLIPKTNILFYPKNKIEEDLSNQFRQLQNINLYVNEKRVLEISVTERTPTYIWCGETLPIANDTTDEQCNFLDANGYMFDQAPYFSGEVYFKFYGDLPKNFSDIIFFKKTLESLGIKPVAFYNVGDGSAIIFISNESSNPMGPEIRFNLDSNYQQVAENLETALTTDPLQLEFQNKYSYLEYIDLRYGNKVYYKFQ